MKILDLGCGKSKYSGAIGVDFSDRHSPDVVHDLNVFPYPFPDSEFDLIVMNNVLEHLDDVLSVMREVHRICKSGGGRVKVIVPYFRSIWAFIDPTHKHCFTVDSFSYFDPQSPICQRYDYVDYRFFIENIIFNESLKTAWWKKPFLWFANKQPIRYELYLSHLIPMDDITYNLKKA